MKIGILGCRGIPNRYGGFEQFAEHLALGLVQRGEEVWVYNSSSHTFRQKKWKGINIIRCFDPEDQIGTIGQFIYDLICILDSRYRNFDVILQLGYTSSSVWFWLMPKKVIVMTNMDGLEWGRSKYSLLVRRFLKWAEKLAVNHSTTLIADSQVIKNHLETKYSIESVYIPYGAELYKPPDSNPQLPWGLVPKNYFLVIARMQPDNHVEEIIKGVIHSGTSLPLVIIGNTSRSKYGRRLKKTYENDQVIFPGPVFDQELLSQLRYHCRLYFHGHSAGGTNPSLLEAMAASAPICAHANLFNLAVLGHDARYFNDFVELSKLLQSGEIFSDTQAIQRNLDKIINHYNWDKVIDAYHNLFRSISRQ